MTEFYVINKRSKAVVYHGSRSKCFAVIHNYPKRPYKITRNIPKGYLPIYHLNMIGHSDVSPG